MGEQGSTESVSVMGCGKDSVSSLILGFCIHFPVCLEVSSAKLCSVNGEENWIVLMLSPPPCQGSLGTVYLSKACPVHTLLGAPDRGPCTCKRLYGTSMDSVCWPSHVCVYVHQGSPERSVLQVDGEVQVGWVGWEIRLSYKPCTSPTDITGAPTKANGHSEQVAFVAFMDLNISSLKDYKDASTSNM